MPVKLITYPGPGPLSDDIHNLDIGNIANETERAKTIKFSSPYCNIQVQHLGSNGTGKSPDRKCLMTEHCLLGACLFGACLSACA